MSPIKPLENPESRTLPPLFMILNHRNRFCLLTIALQWTPFYFKRVPHLPEPVVDFKQRESYGDTTTTRDFPRYVENYRVWWVEREGRLQQQDPSYTPIPPFPITVAKVVFFLDYEKSRPKRKCGGGEILGTQVGSSLVSQTINALEAKRKRECHKHPKNHDTQKSLRDDLRTKVIEGAMKHKKP
ncbi:hypothetical protein M422DRAFT_253212 [Sphaerobolus stellatus SS14]|uniref:Uncharacterized protein n=1 Tax=Sphaerobolus stellatus (strain SS14) TaxID=990650 RepID=A0A0C9V9G4_SPHS4|nr:hypothetical protein M422DRAFT_253212 [Sphaerobolus stellatus SS14]